MPRSVRRYPARVYLDQLEEDAALVRERSHHDRVGGVVLLRWRARLCEELSFRQGADLAAEDLVAYLLGQDMTLTWSPVAALFAAGKDAPAVPVPFPPQRDGGMTPAPWLLWPLTG